MIRTTSLRQIRYLIRNVVQLILHMSDHPMVYAAGQYATLPALLVEATASAAESPVALYWGSSHPGDYYHLREIKRRTRGERMAAGFHVRLLRSTLDSALAYNDRWLAAVARGEKPAQRSATLIHGQGSALASANVGRGLVNGDLVPIEVVAIRT